MSDNIQKRLQLLERLLRPAVAVLPEGDAAAILAELEAIRREVGLMHDRMADWQTMYQLLHDWADGSEPFTTRHQRREQRREAG